MITMEWPDKPDGRPIEYVASIKTAVIFKNAKNKAAAKEFMRFFLQPENLGPHLEGSLARWFPVDKRLVDTPYLEGQERPAQGRRGAAVHAAAAEPWPHVFNHRLIQINAENAYGKAVTRCRARRVDGREGGRRADRPHEGGRRGDGRRCRRRAGPGRPAASRAGGGRPWP